MKKYLVLLFSFIFMASAFAQIKPHSDQEITQHRLDLFSQYCLKMTPDARATALKQKIPPLVAPGGVSAWSFSDEFGSQAITQAPPGIFDKQDKGTCGTFLGKADVTAQISDWLKVQFPGSAITYEGKGDKNGHIFNFYSVRADKALTETIVFFIYDVQSTTNGINAMVLPAGQFDSAKFVK